MTTTSQTLTTEWEEVSTTDCSATVSSENDFALFFVGTSAPSAGTKVGVEKKRLESVLFSASSDVLYARALNSSVTITVIK